MPARTVGVKEGERGKRKEQTRQRSSAGGFSQRNNKKTHTHLKKNCPFFGVSTRASSTEEPKKYTRTTQTSIHPSIQLTSIDPSVSVLLPVQLQLLLWCRCQHHSRSIDCIRIHTHTQIERERENNRERERESNQHIHTHDTRHRQHQCVTHFAASNVISRGNRQHKTTLCIKEQIQ